MKGGLSTTQPLRGDELRAVRAWLRERARMKPTGKAFFVSEQRKPLHRSTVNLALRKYSTAASLPLLAHPHMLRQITAQSIERVKSMTHHPLFTPSSAGELMSPMNRSVLELCRSYGISRRTDRNRERLVCFARWLTSKENSRGRWRIR
jgi:hypothetical protein